MDKPLWSFNPLKLPQWASLLWPTALYTHSIDRSQTCSSLQTNHRSAVLHRPSVHGPLGAKTYFLPAPFVFSDQHSGATMITPTSMSGSSWVHTDNGIFSSRWQPQKMNHSCCQLAVAGHGGATNTTACQSSSIKDIYPPISQIYIKLASTIKQCTGS